MKHLQPHQEGFRFRTADEGNIIQINISYDKGGANYFHGSNDRRGVYVSIIPAEIKNGMFTCLIGKGIRSCVKVLPRRSAKEVLDVAERLDTFCRAAAVMYQAGHDQLAIGFLKEKANPVDTVATA